MTDVVREAAPKPGSTPLATEKEAREVAEAAREKTWEAPSLVRGLFEGSVGLDLVHPFRETHPEEGGRARRVMVGGGRPSRSAWLASPS